MGTLCKQEQPNLAREYNCGIMQNIGEVEVRSHLLLGALPSLHFTELAGFGLLILCFYNSVKMLKFRHFYKLCLSLSPFVRLTGFGLILKIIHCEL